MGLTAENIKGFIRTVDELKQWTINGYNVNKKEGNLTLLTNNNKPDTYIILVNGSMDNLTSAEKDLCINAYFDLEYDMKDKDLFYRYYMPFMSEHYPYLFNDKDIYSYNNLVNKLNKDVDTLNRVRENLRKCDDSTDYSYEDYSTRVVEIGKFPDNKEISIVSEDKVDYLTFIKNKAENEHAYYELVATGIRNKQQYLENLLNPKETDEPIME